MKKNILLVLIIAMFVPSAVLAADWDYFGNMDRMWDGQESVTNKEFEEVMDALQSNQKKKDEKQRKKLIKKISGGGTSLHNGLEPDSKIQEIPALKSDTEGQLLNLPVNVVIEENVLDKGFYKIIGEKNKNSEVYLLFYQSEFLKGKVKAVETKDDFGENELDFVKMLPVDGSKIKIIFGSLGFNAYVYLPVLPEPHIK